MSNVTPIDPNPIDPPVSALAEIKRAAMEEVQKETSGKAKAALVRKYRDLDSARRVVANIEREISDLEASIEDGSFCG